MDGRTGNVAAHHCASAGHQSTAATQIYARINIDPVREAMESANKAIGKAMRQKPAPRLKVAARA